MVKYAMEACTHCIISHTGMNAAAYSASHVFAQSTAVESHFTPVGENRKGIHKKIVTDAHPTQPTSE